MILDGIHLRGPSMSDRLTPEWTETLDEAFGASGTKGLSLIHI